MSVPLSYPRPADIAAPPALPQYAFPGPPVDLSSVYPAPPSDLTPLPDLPSGQRKPIWHNDPRIPYKLTTHIVPAAHFREDCDDVLPEALPADGSMSKEERKEFVRKSEARLRELRRGYIDKGRKPQKKALWLCLNRYVRDSNSAEGGFTLFFAHANGFHKEAWEPAIMALLSSQESQALVREIWVWDAFNHGDSALLNKGNLNSLMHVRTAVRDCLTFLIYFLPPSSDTPALPVHLPRVAQSEIQRRFKDGFLGADSPRLPICAFGHSFGGPVCTLSAISHPSLFTALTLIDPVITYPRTDFYYNPVSLALGALGRRAWWKSRDDAKKGFLTSQFFSIWDPRVLELYVEAGLYEEGDGTIRLKMPPVQEATVFIDAELGAAEAWSRLYRKELDVRIKLKWIMPGPGRGELDSRPNATQARVWLRPENASNLRVEGSGHLITQEKPDILGQEIGILLREAGDALEAQSPVSKARL